MNESSNKIHEAVVTAIHAADDRPETAAALVEVAGLSLLEHALRRLSVAGVRRVRVLATEFSDDVHRALEDMRGIPKDTAVIDLRFRRDSFLENENLLFLDPRVLVEEPVFCTLIHQEKPVLGILEERDLVYGRDSLLKLDDDGTRFSGFAILPKKLVEDAILLDDFEENPLQALLGIVLASHAVGKANIARMARDSYQTEDLQLRVITAFDERDAAERSLLKWSTPRLGDLATRFINPVLERWLARLSLLVPVPGNWLMVLATIFGFAALGLMAKAHMAWALAFGILFYITLSGALRLCRMQADFHISRSTPVSALRQFDILLYAAFAFSGYGEPGFLLQCAMVLIVLAFAFGTERNLRFFRAMTGRNLGEEGSFERRLQLFAATGQMRLWIFVICFLAGYPEAGIVFVTLYAAAYFFVAQWRTFKRLLP